MESALQRIETAVNNLGINAAVAPRGFMPAPPQVQQLTVKADGNGNVHAVVSDANAIQKNIHYFVEYDTDKAFSQPHVVHLGASRTMSPIALPAMDDAGNAHQFFFRAYSQYPGGKPGTPIQFGGETATPVSPSGTAKMRPLPSTGSGTAQNSGQVGGSGFGQVLYRPTSGPKRRNV